MSIAEIQDAPLVPARQIYPSSEFYNQPGWSTRAARLAEVIYKFDRGDTPSPGGHVGCYASLARLAKEAGMPRSTTSRWLAWLKKEGVLIEIGHSVSGVIYRRIRLKWDVQEKVNCRDIITETFNGMVTHRRRKKSEIPAPTLRAHWREGGVPTDGNRNGIGSETRNPLKAPLQGAKSFNSDFQTGARNVPTSQPETTNQETDMKDHIRYGGEHRVSKLSTNPAQKAKDSKFRERVMANPEICELLSARYPVEKQNDGCIRVLGQKLRKGTITPELLKLALWAEANLHELDKPIKHINDFHHFLRAFEYLVSYGLDPINHRANVMMAEAITNLHYPEVQADLNKGLGLAAEEFAMVCHWTEEDIRDLRAGGEGNRTITEVSELARVNAIPFLKAKFNEAFARYKQHTEEALA